jgi:ribosomal-protein-alanine N-acetyltransferase
MNGTGFPEIFPRLETERLVLREITPDDRDGAFRNFSDLDVAIWFFDEPFREIDQVDQIIQEFIQDFEQGKDLTWAITLKENNEFLGTCGFGDVEIGSRGEIGFDLAKEHWGKGLMSEALRAVIDYGFDVLGVGSIEAHTYSTNARAIRLLRKLGFHLDGVREDSHYFVMTRQDRANPES